MYLGLGAETDSSDILVMSFQQPNALHIHISSSTTWISFSDTLELVLHTKVRYPYRPGSTQLLQ
jgi:hypothetical protein